MKCLVQMTKVQITCKNLKLSVKFSWRFWESEIFPVWRIIQYIPNGLLFISKSSISAFWVIFIGNLQRIIRVFTQSTISYWRLDVSGPCKTAICHHLKEIKFLAQLSLLSPERSWAAYNDSFSDDGHSRQTPPVGSSGDTLYSQGGRYLLLSAPVE